MKRYLSLTLAACCLAVGSAAMAGLCDNFTKFDPDGDFFCYTNDVTKITYPGDLPPWNPPIPDYDKISYLHCSLFSSKIRYAKDGSIRYSGGPLVTIGKGGGVPLKSCKDPQQCVGWSNEKREVSCKSDEFVSSSGRKVYYHVTCPYNPGLILLNGPSCKWTMK